jgi:hypothetical protein
MDQKTKEITMITKLIINSILFIILILSGFWMAKLGKPYNPMAFNIHKFIALAFIVYTLILSKGLTQSTAMNLANWVFLVLSVLFILLVLISGGFLSSKGEVIKPLVQMHKLSSGLVLLSVIGWFYFCLK